MIEKENNGKIENVFYAALALHVADKPLNKENIRIVLNAAGTPIDEPTLDIIGDFIGSLKAKGNTDSYSDDKIIKLLTSALSHQTGRTEQLEALLGELKKKVKPDSVLTKIFDEKQITEPIQLPPSAELSDKITVIRDTGVCNTGEVIERKEELPIAALPEGRYIYGIAKGVSQFKPGPVGINGCSVYTIVSGDLSAIVHSCLAEPYQSKNEETVQGWVKTHQSVLEAAREQFEVVIPLGFDTILTPVNDSVSVDHVVIDWLQKESEHFHGVMDKITGRDEYVVQISYVPSVINMYMANPGMEVLNIKSKIAGASPGIAYIYKQKLEKILKEDIEKLTDSWFKDFFGRVSKYSDEIIIEKNRKQDKEKVMLLNLSCLVNKTKIEALGDELGIINNMEGLSVHFSGPWPPYSFVNKTFVNAGNKDNGTY